MLVARISARIMAAITLLVGNGCHTIAIPSRTEAGRVDVRIERRGSRERIAHGTWLSEWFSNVSPTSVWATRSLVYAAKRQGKWYWFLGHDKEPISGPWSNLRTLASSETRLLYLSEQGVGECVGRILATPDLAHKLLCHQAVVNDSLRVSEGHDAYIAEGPIGKFSIVLDGNVMSNFWVSARGLTVDRAGIPAYVASDESSTWLVLGSEKHGPCRQIASYTRASAVGFYAFSCQQDDTLWYVLSSASEQLSQQGYLSVSGIATSRQGGVAFVAQSTDNPEKSIVVSSLHANDGNFTQSAAFSYVVESTLRFSADGQYLAYVHGDENGERVVYGNRFMNYFEQVTGLSFAPDDSRWGFVGQRDGVSEIWTDEKLIGRYRFAFDLQLGAGRTIGFVYFDHESKDTVVFHNGRESRHDLVVPGSLVLSQDGRHWGALIGDSSMTGSELLIVVDGVKIGTVGLDEITWIVRRVPMPKSIDGESMRELRRLVLRSMTKYLSTPVDEETSRKEGQ